jgi:hypothetical protein
LEVLSDVREAGGQRLTAGNASARVLHEERHALIG